MSTPLAADPAERIATAPAEARGLARDGVRLLFTNGHRIHHVRFRDIGDFLTAGDLLVVNTSATIPAALDGVRLDATLPGGERSDWDRQVVVHLSTELDDGSWVAELRQAPAGASPLLDAHEGERVSLPGGARLTLARRHARPAPSSPLTPVLGPATARREEPTRLWRARLEVPAGQVRPYLLREGRPISYGHGSQRWPLSAYQTVFAIQPGSAEMPSAGRPFTPELVVRLLAAGVAVAPVMLHTGVSSLDAGEVPYPERFEVPPATARLIDVTRRAGGRIVAVGTTVVRAVESAVAADGSLTPARGWTDLVLGPDRPSGVVDGLITGWHDAGSSHLLLLESVVGRELVETAGAAAAEHGYLRHEFGDSCLLLPARPVGCGRSR